MFYIENGKYSRKNKKKGMGASGTRCVTAFLYMEKVNKSGTHAEHTFHGTRCYLFFTKQTGHFYRTEMYMLVTTWSGTSKSRCKEHLQTETEEASHDLIRLATRPLSSEARVKNRNKNGHTMRIFWSPWQGRDFDAM
jgi:hypothetical protein